MINKEDFELINKYQIELKDKINELEKEYQIKHKEELNRILEKYKLNVGDIISTEHKTYKIIRFIKSGLIVDLYPSSSQNLYRLCLCLYYEVETYTKNLTPSKRKKIGIWKYRSFSENPFHSVTLLKSGIE